MYASNAAIAAIIITITACSAPSQRPTPLPPPTPVITDEPIPPATPPIHAEEIRTLEGITEYRLPNGLQILLFPDVTRSTITVNMTYLVGSRHEGHGEAGLAHLLEHLTFKGTTHYPLLSQALEDRGATENGSTWFDRTNYYETLPASADNLAFALDVEAERMREALLTAEDLATELEVVQNELEMGESDLEGMLEERVFSAAYLWHGYGKAIGGPPSDIARVPLERVRAFYETWYQPDAAVLVVAGRFDQAAALAAVEQAFGSIPRPTRTLPVTYTVEPVQDGERAVTLARSAEVRQLVVAYHAVAGADPDYAAVEAAADVLTREASGRLYDALVEPGMAAGVTGYSYPLREPGLVLFGVDVDDGEALATVKKQLLATIEGLAKTRITAKEVDRYRAATLRDLARTMFDSEALAVELSEYAALGDWRLLFAYRDQVERVTVADVERVAATWLIGSNRTVAELIPTDHPVRAPVAGAPDVAAIADAVRGRDVEPGEAFDATIEHLVARTRNEELDGGIAAALLPKKTRGGTVRLSLTLWHGDLDSLQGKAAVAAMAAAVAARGTKNRDFQALADEQARLQAEISISGDAGDVSIEIETIRASLPAALDLAAEMLRTPSFDADELELVRDDAIANLEEAAQDPWTRATLELEALRSPYPRRDPRRTMTIAEEIAAYQKLEVKDLVAYQRDFWGAGHGELVVIGDFDADALITQVEARFGAWTSKHPYQRLPAVLATAAGATTRIAIADKPLACVAAGAAIDLRDDDPDYPAAQLAGYVLGGSGRSRLWMRLREREGWSYDTSAAIVASAVDRWGMLDLDAIVAPGDLAAAEAAALDELTRLARDGVTLDELELARTAWIESTLAALADDAALADELAGRLHVGRTLASMQTELDAVRALTAADVSAAAAKYLDPATLQIVEVGTF